MFEQPLRVACKLSNSLCVEYACLDKHCVDNNSRRSHRAQTQRLCCAMPQACCPDRAGSISLKFCKLAAENTVTKHVVGSL